MIIIKVFLSSPPHHHHHHHHHKQYLPQNLWTRKKFSCWNLKHLDKCQFLKHSFVYFSECKICSFEALVSHLWSDFLCWLNINLYLHNFPVIYFIIDCSLPTVFSEALNPFLSCDHSQWRRSLRRSSRSSPRKRMVACKTKAAASCLEHPLPSRTTHHTVEPTHQQFSCSSQCSP